MTNLKGKTALITGASRGIGAAIAKAYAAAGAHVILLARTTAGLEAVDDEITKAGGTATLIPQDLTDMDAIDRLGPALAQRIDKLDIFVGNAGMLGALGPLTHMDPKVWQRVFDVNVTANYRLLRTLEPLLNEAPAPRVMFVSGDTATLTNAYWGLYAASKAALNTMIECYAAEKKNSAMDVKLIRPGAVKTALLDKAFPGGFPGPVKEPEDVAHLFLDNL